MRPGNLSCQMVITGGRAWTRPRSSICTHFPNVRGTLRPQHLGRRLFCPGMAYTAMCDQDDFAPEATMPQASLG